MKSSGPLTIALSLTLAVASVLAADAKKKPAPKGPPPAEAKPEAAPAAKAAPLPETVAVVEGVPIKKAELEDAFQNVLRAQRIPADQIPAEERAMGYRMILDELII